MFIERRRAGNVSLVNAVLVGNLVLQAALPRYGCHLNLGPS